MCLYACRFGTDIGCEVWAQRPRTQQKPMQPWGWTNRERHRPTELRRMEPIGLKQQYDLHRWQGKELLLYCCFHSVSALRSYSLCDCRAAVAVWQRCASLFTGWTAHAGWAESRIKAPALSLCVFEPRTWSFPAVWFLFWIKEYWGSWRSYMMWNCRHTSMYENQPLTWWYTYYIDPIAFC